MAPVIRISAGNWDRLKEWAIPLEDSADDALGKVLDAAEGRGSQENLASLPVSADGNGGGSSSNRPPKGEKVPLKAYEMPILHILYEKGGRSKSKEVLDEVEQKMEHQFGEVDYRLLSDRSPRWSKTAHFARYSLVKDGYLKQPKESGRGIWELTEKGIAKVETQRGTTLD